MSVKFDSTSSFQDYFRQKDQLIILPNSPLIIEETQVITERILTRQEMPTEDLLHAIETVIRQILYPLGKVATVQIKEKSSVDYEMSTRLFFKCSTGFSIFTRRGEITTRLEALFNMMVVTSKLQLSLSPGQKLTILRVRPEEVKLHDIIRHRSPPGFNVDWSHIRRIRQKFGSNSLSLSSEGLIRFLLTETYTFGNFSEFRKRLILTGEMKIPKRKELVILGSSFKANIPDFTCFFSFLNKGFLPVGKTVKVEGAKELDVQVDSLRVRGFGEMKIWLANGDLRVNLLSLADRMVRSRQEYFQVHPGQTLYIRMDEKETTFPCRPGYHWAIKNEDSIEKKCVVDKNGSWQTLTSKSSIFFYLIKS